MRFDLLIIAIGLLLIVAMTLTLLFGREYSRHGYGAIVPGNKEGATIIGLAPVFFDFPRATLRVPRSSLRPSLQNRKPFLGPGINPTVQVVNLRVALPGQIINDLGAA